MLTTYPDSNNLSTYAASFSQKADFGRFHSIGLQFDDYIASSHDLTASKRGGNCTTRGSDTPTTRPLKASCSAKPPPPPAQRVPGEPASLAAAPVGGGRAWPRCWSAAGPGRAIHSDTAPLVWRAPEGPEGTGGLRGGAWLRCPWAVAGPGRASRRRAERSSRRGRLAGGPQTTGTPSSSAPRMRKPRPADAGRGFRYPVGYEV